MTDDTPDLQAARERRLKIRAMIRQHNHERPRCSGCGNDMLVFAPDDFVTNEQFADPGYEYLRQEDFRPGDLICFWCIVSIAGRRGQCNRPTWGHA
jgi:hypothetical protein